MLIYVCFAFFLTECEEKRCGLGLAYPWTRPATVQRMNRRNVTVGDD
jgi:hypothetical protein